MKIFLAFQHLEQDASELGFRLGGGMPLRAKDDQLAGDILAHILQLVALLGMGLGGSTLPLLCREGVAGKLPLLCFQVGEGATWVLKDLEVEGQPR